MPSQPSWQACWNAVRPQSCARGSFRRSPWWLLRRILAKVALRTSSGSRRICAKNTKPETCALEAEAGMGGDEGEENKFCFLHCLREGSRERRKAKPKEEGTRRAVDRPPLTAPAATPNTQSPSSPWQWR